MIKKLYKIYKRSKLLQRLIYKLYLPNYFYLYRYTTDYFYKTLNKLSFFIISFYALRNLVKKSRWEYLCNLQLRGGYSSRSGQDQTLKNIFLFGGSRCGLDSDKNLLFLAGCPYSSPLELLTNYLIDEEANDYVSFSKRSSSLRIRFLGNGPERKAGGVTVFAMNPNSGNLYHFLIEALFDFSNAILNGVHIDNIIVDEVLPDKFLGLVLDISPKINVIKLKKFEAIEVEQLLVFKNINYHYHWHRKLFSDDGLDTEEILRSDKPHYMNSEWLKKFRKMLSGLYLENENNKYAEGPTSILFIRNAPVRNTLNQNELIDFFREHGLVVDPALASFQELSILLRDAKYICTQAGAAIVNALFCRNSPTFVCWFYKGPETDIELLIEFFDALEIKLVEILATPIANKSFISGSNKIHQMQEADISQSDLICPVSELAKNLVVN